ncbi:MAG TPA: penicillin-binding protein [Cyanobacteria bacterium UBA8530]|nr:penicillin-binding protein [Cyanobacteria bacterium UBA8530]
MMKKLKSLLLLLFLVLLPFQARGEPVATQIFDSSGRGIAHLRGTEPKAEIPLREIPRALQCAVIAMEDARFYSHVGIDLKGTLRALFTDIAQRKKAEGGSTITQQVARNLYLNPEKSFARKANEALIALKLERTYSKDQILELYLNRIYWGHGAYGIEGASRTYFGKSCRALTIPESALLAGLIQSPENYSPFKSRKTALRRQHLVLNRLAELGYLKKDEAERYKRVPLHFSLKPGESFRAPYFTSWLVAQLSARLGKEAVQRGKLKIWTTLDLALQEEAEKLIKNLVKKEGRVHHFDQAALVAIDPRNGFIRAMVGGFDFEKSQFNRATMALRQGGSTFKPFIYLTAFSQGLSPEATCSDLPVPYSLGNGKKWTPRNFKNERDGILSYRQALEKSNNVIAIKLLNQVGVGEAIDTAHKLGLDTPFAPNLSFGLGACEVRPLDLASAYGVLANGGMRVEPSAVMRVEDAEGRILEEKKNSGHQVFDSRSVATLNQVLEGVVERGTGKGARIGRVAAGKTGTTDDSRDAWFVGYTPQLVAVLWVGNDKNSPMRGDATGGKICAPTWAKFMKLALKKEPPLPFPTPTPAPTPLPSESPPPPFAP